jgi:hypothetical protein
MLDEAAIVRRFGVSPESIPGYLALVGDAADGRARRAGAELACPLDYCNQTSCRLHFRPQNTGDGGFQPSAPPRRRIKWLLANKLAFGPQRAPRKA